MRRDYFVNSSWDCPLIVCWKNLRSNWCIVCIVCGTRKRYFCHNDILIYQPWPEIANFTVEWRWEETKSSIVDFIPPLPPLGRSLLNMANCDIQRGREFQFEFCNQSQQTTQSSMFIFSSWYTFTALSLIQLLWRMLMPVISGHWTWSWAGE